jgi:hypothetical protein
VPAAAEGLCGTEALSEETQPILRDVSLRIEPDKDSSSGTSISDTR